MFEPGSFRPLAMVVDGPGLAGGAGGAPERRVCHYHLDHLGTPRELTDARGRIVWSARYRAYGAVLKLEHDEVDNPLRFQGLTTTLRPACTTTCSVSTTPRLVASSTRTR